jgi:anti-sigma-K factor RskA
VNHDSIDELLSGYALRTLSGEDATEADRLLSEHVPSCAACRQTLDAFRAVTADLALDARPADPPETLLPRLHREMEPRGRRVARWQPARLVAAAAGLVFVVSLGGVALLQSGDGGVTGGPQDFVTMRNGDIAEAVQFATKRDAQQTPMGQAMEYERPGVERFYVLGTEVPQPPTGMVYALWLVSGSETTLLGSFVPDPATGLVVLRIDLDPTGVDTLFVTLEPAGATPVSPGPPAASWTPAA